MLRILLINWRDIANPEAGGAEVHLHEIAKRFVVRGHRVTVLASAFPGGRPEEEIDGVRVVRRGGKFLFNFHVPAVCRKLLKEEGFDIVIDDINKIPFYTPLYVRRPLLAFAHHLFAQTIFLETALPLALYVYLSEALIGLIYRRARFIVVSESTKMDFVRRGIPERNIRVVYNAVDHGRYSPLASRRSDRPLIAYIGRIKRYKRVEHLLRASKVVFARVPDARLEIAGSGDHLDSLVSMARKLGIADRVNFRGFVSEEEKIDLLRRAHVVVNPSSKEGWGVTVIEANACGTPVIASDVPGLRDAVRHGQTGLLVPYGDTAGFAASISDVLKDDQMRSRLSEGALAWAGKFNWDDSAEAILEAISDMVADAQPTGG